MREIERRRDREVDARALRRASIAAALALVVVLFAAPPAPANPGFELDEAHPSRSLPGPPRGIAVDQATRDIYVAITSTNPGTGAPGEIARFGSGLGAKGEIGAGGGFYSGVALNPTTADIYAAQMKIPTPYGDFGTPKLDKFASTGESIGSFNLVYTDSLPQIATESLGRIFYPNVNTQSVQVLNASGATLENITCGGCPGGSFGRPASVALTPAGALYVADAAPDRVVKLVLAGGSYVYSSTLQSGRGAGAVAVDPGTGDVFVGDMPGGTHYHIVAYDSSGLQYDDFGAGISPNSTTGYGALSAYQIAADGTSHELYVGASGAFLIFEKVAVAALPEASAVAPTEIGQLTATLSAVVNANGHAALECTYELVQEAEFQATGFADSVDLPCPTAPDGTRAVSLSRQTAGLSPATAYRYRITVSTNSGTDSSGNQAFETPPEIPPTATTQAPQDLTNTTATIRASANPRGGSVTDCHFELGTSTAYGTNLSCAPKPGPVAVAVSVARKVSGLLPATAYHYRVVIETNAGSAAGDDVAFTTASLPVTDPDPEPTQEPSPPSPPPAAPTTTAPPSGPVVTTHRSRCRKGFRRRRIHGKPRCVKFCRRGLRKKRVHRRVVCVRKKRAPKRRRHRRHAHRAQLSS